MRLSKFRFHQICISNFKSVFLTSATIVGLTGLSFPVSAIELGPQLNETLHTSIQFEQLYGFGDSISDIGNTFNLVGFPPPPYVDGRFSNGKIWVDFLADYFKVNPTPITAFDSATSLADTDGINFAFGSATSGLDFRPSLGIEVGVLAQVETFINLLNQNAQTLTNSNALYTLFVGGSDYLNLPNLPNTVEETELIYSQTVNNISTVLTQLAENNAKNILVLNLPDLDKLPLSASLVDSQKTSLNNLVLGHNELLKNEIQNLSTVFPKTNFTLFDLNGLSNQIQEKPENFGLTNATNGCLMSPECLDADSYLFWDEVHFTTAGYRILADSVLESLAAKLAWGHEYLKALPDDEKS
ncbi:SGNH/GDSL hydrolase family protein, partial [Crocosphaera sp. Alani8]|uniref:SGNH/GDSL hydrolase family protein n=1 Tax=Crocosphaera sp. Alani8 TaxID=3038952 RepID=UPI00313C4EAA